MAKSRRRDRKAQLSSDKDDSDGAEPNVNAERDTNHSDNKETEGMTKRQKMAYLQKKNGIKAVEKTLHKADDCSSLF